MLMRESLASIVEKFSVYVEGCAELTPETRATMLWIVTEAFKGGFAVGVQKSHEATTDVSNYIRQVLSTTGNNYPEGEDIDPAFMGSWQASITIENRVKEALFNLLKEELH